MEGGGEGAHATSQNGERSARTQTDQRRGREDSASGAKNRNNHTTTAITLCGSCTRSPPARLPAAPLSLSPSCRVVTAYLCGMGGDEVFTSTGRAWRRTCPVPPGLEERVRGSSRTTKGNVREAGRRGAWCVLLPPRPLRGDFWERDRKNGIKSGRRKLPELREHAPYRTASPQWPGRGPRWKMHAGSAPCVLSPPCAAGRGSAALGFPWRPSRPRACARVWGF